MEKHLECWVLEGFALPVESVELSPFAQRWILHKSTLASDEGIIAPIALFHGLASVESHRSRRFDSAVDPYQTH